VEPTARWVVIPFAPLQTGQTLRLRIAETYTAPSSYRTEGEELVFDREPAGDRKCGGVAVGVVLHVQRRSGYREPTAGGRVRLVTGMIGLRRLDVLLKAKRRVGGEGVSGSARKRWAPSSSTPDVSCGWFGYPRKVMTLSRF